METEQLEIFQFIRRFAPFDHLPEEMLERVAENIEISYYRAETKILEYGDEIHDLFMIRSGSVEIYRRSGELYNRLSEGDLFGQMGLLMKNKVRLPATALEDSLVYLIPEVIFNQLCDQFPEFAEFVEAENQARLRQTVSKREDANELLSSPVKKLLTRAPVMMDCNVSVQQAALKMTDEGVSSLLLRHVEGGEQQFDYQVSEDHEIVGIITDRDLRTRVISEGLGIDVPVGQIMSKDLVIIDASMYVFEAMLTMLRYNLHHLPVLHYRRPIGVIALSDVIRYETQSSLFVVSQIFRQDSVAKLKMLADEVRSCFVRMVNEDANSQMIGAAMSVIGRSFKQRLLEMAEEQLGPPPVPYCFLALGSMARDEQLVVTDQDNAMILDNRFDRSEHGEYFDALAKFVSDGLATCGYSYCTGGVMATNRKWQKTRKEWEATFREWIDYPKPQALLDSNIFFDLDGVYGETRWADQLMRKIAEHAKRNQRFLACMARNALNRTPPLGFFKEFVMEKDGRHRNSINLKRRGTAPLADLIRVHALAVGSTSQNSFDRLDDIIEAKVLPRGTGPDLRDAMEFISMVRIRHQALDIESGNDPDNNIEPENLSAFERRNLKDAFQIVSNAQKYLRFHYQAFRLG